MHIPSSTLTRERLWRLLAALDRAGGRETLRQLRRLRRIQRWEVEQAAALGWVSVETVKPRVGRVSHIAKRLGNSPVAKLPRLQAELPRPVRAMRWRHHFFAILTTGTTYHGGVRWGSLRLPPHVEGYLAVFPRARSRAGAASSCSRLLRHRDVQAVREWIYTSRRCPCLQGEPIPRTAQAIWQRLAEIGC